MTRPTGYEVWRMLLAAQEANDLELHDLLSRLDEKELRQLLRNLQTISGAIPEVTPAESTASPVLRRTPAPVNDLVSMSGRYGCEGL